MWQEREGEVDQHRRERGRPRRRGARARSSRPRGSRRQRAARRRSRSRSWPPPLRGRRPGRRRRARARAGAHARSRRRRRDRLPDQLADRALRRRKRRRSSRTECLEQERDGACERVERVVDRQSARAAAQPFEIARARARETPPRRRAEDAEPFHRLDLGAAPPPRRALVAIGEQSAPGAPGGRQPGAPRRSLARPPRERRGERARSAVDRLLAEHERPGGQAAGTGEADVEDRGRAARRERARRRERCFDRPDPAAERLRSPACESSIGVAATTSTAGP